MLQAPTKVVKRFLLHDKTTQVLLEKLMMNLYHTTLTEVRTDGKTKVIKEGTFEAPSNRAAVRKLRWWLNKNFPKESE